MLIFFIEQVGKIGEQRYKLHSEQQHCCQTVKQKTTLHWSEKTKIKYFKKKQGCVNVGMFFILVRH